MNLSGMSYLGTIRHTLFNNSKPIIGFSQLELHHNSKKPPSSAQTPMRAINHGRTTDHLAGLGPRQAFT